MTKKLNETFDKTTEGWAYDVYYSHSLWLRRALFAIVVLFILLAISLVSHLFLLPLKEKVPYLYAFDHATGEITKVGTLEKSSLSANWELTRYFLIHYVINYESYHYDHINEPYQMVWAQSGDTVKKQYDELVRSSNPQSPFRLYGKDKFISVKVNSVNALNPNTVHIRFEKTLHYATTNTLKVSQKEAIIKWEYSETQLSEKMLERDPLGFKVTYYQVSQVNLENNER